MNDTEAKIELISNVLKETHGKVSPRTVLFFDAQKVLDLLHDLHAAIREEREQYYLGVVALAQGATNTLTLVDGRKRLTIIAILLDSIRHRLMGSKHERVEENRREVAQCIDDFLDAIVKSMRKAVRVKTLHRWLEFIERQLFIATVTAPSTAYMKVTRQLSRRLPPPLPRLQVSLRASEERQLSLPMSQLLASKETEIRLNVCCRDLPTITCHKRAERPEF